MQYKFCRKNLDSKRNLNSTKYTLIISKNPKRTILMRKL